MNEHVPKNDEMYARICGRIDRHAWELWDRLIKFSQDNGLLEESFTERCSSDFQACFWEVYLPKVFDEAGITLKKEKPVKNKGGPDFCFEKDGKKIWIEAVACGEPKPGGPNVFSPPSNDPSNFESGLTPEPKIMQRLAGAVSIKIEQSRRHRKNIDKQDSYVIAVNGYRALNGYLHDQVDFDPQLIVKTLFGMTDLRLASGEPYYGCSDKTSSGAPIAHFLKSENKDISGILYSAAHIWQTGLPPGHDFIYIQNPHAPDLTSTFPSFTKWTLSSDGKVRREAPIKK